MSGFVRRFTEIPTLEVIREIEGLVIVDLAPPAPATGAGTGVVLLVGEFEDGYFATDEEAQGAVEVYGSADYQVKFGSFGYTYSGVKANHPSARRGLAEDWNGNGFLKSFKLKCSRLLIARADTSVGEVAFAPLPTIKSSGTGPWALAVGMILSATTNAGTGTTAALAATRATLTGAGEAIATIVSGDTVGIALEDGRETIVTFGASDTTLSAVIARINTTLGATIASADTTHLVLTGLKYGSAGKIVLRETTTGVLAKLGFPEGSLNGTGNVANLAAVTAAEVVALVNASASMGSADVAAQVGPDGKLWLYHTTSAAASTLQVDPGTGGMAAALGFTLDTDVTLATNEAGTIPAGTRVQASTISGGEWVTMQTLDVPAGASGPILVRVRPGLDNGTHVGANVATINTLVDVPSFAAVSVTNPALLSAALTEGQKDAAYIEALDATLNELGVARDANYLLIARRSDAVVRAGRENATTATSIGMFGRKYVMGGMLGATPSEAIADVASYRSDRVFYAPLALKVKVPQIAERGLAGGQGFTADGVITVRSDGPLTTVCAMLAPEENIGQQTNLIDDFFAVNAYGQILSAEVYKAFKRAGLCAPRIDRESGTIFQSEQTTSLESGRETIKRRRFADFIQDTSIGVFKPYVKRLNKAATRAKMLGKWNQFLSGLKSENAPEKSRLLEFATDDSINAGNTAAVLAQGVYYIVTTVKQHPSLDDIVVQTEIGENAVISKAL